MANHAGPRRCECPPGTKLWRSPAFVTQEKYETKFVGNGSSYCFVSYFSPSEDFFWSYKNGNGAAKTGLQRRAGGRHNLVPGGHSLSCVRGRRGLSYTYVHMWACIQMSINKQNPRSFSFQ